MTTTTYDDPEGSHVNKSEENDPVKGLRTTFIYDPLNRETTRTVRLEGEDGDPVTGVQSFTTSTAYDDAEHAVRTTDPRGVVTRRRLDGLDRVVEETVDVDGLAPAPALALTTTSPTTASGTSRRSPTRRARRRPSTTTGSDGCR